MEQVGIGVIGCGNISDIYFKTAESFKILKVLACADIIPERAQAKAEKYGIPKACSVEELLADSEVRIVVNLTIPKAHAEVGLQVIEAGKCLYNEKPLAISREEGQRLLTLASEKKVLIGCAPDTFMGAGLQTCRKLLDDGWIGEPVGASAFMLCHGHEHWHPDPDFYYQPGGGPMFDMGPYYLTALISLLGPVKRVSGFNRITFPTRVITSKEKYGETIKVNTPTHITGIMDFHNGAIGTITTSFDVWSTSLHCLELYGTEGTLLMPDPNKFGGPVRLKRERAAEWSEIPLTHGYPENTRGLGVADMAYALIYGRPHRANGTMAFHVLDIMQAFLEASKTGQAIELASTCDRPASLPLNLPHGKLDT